MPEANIQKKSMTRTDTRKTFRQLFAHFLISSRVSSKRTLRDNIFWIHFGVFYIFTEKNGNQENFWKKFGCLAYIYAKYQIPIYSQTNA